MSFESFVETYGYWALLFGTLVEGETILIIGGFLAHRGYLYLPWVVLAAFVGSLCGDQLYFLLGRKRGRALLQKRPWWQANIARVDKFMSRMHALFAAGAVFAVGLGFAMQNISQNFVSGVILLIERTIKPGDILQVETEIVRVKRMGIRATVSRTLDDEEIIIPNSVLVQNSVKNYTLQDSLFRLRTLVGVIYGSNMALVRETLERTTREIPWRVQAVQPRILMKQFGNSSVDFDVSVWIDDPWKKQVRLSELNERIWWALKEAGIVIAFPQLDVHFDPPVMSSIQHFSGTAQMTG
jgi:hypothetical protein